MDELWGFVGKKQKRLKSGEGADKGDQYVFVPLDAVNKPILSYRMGKRDGETTRAFVADLRSRVLNEPQISTDGFEPYVGAITEAFGEAVHYGQIVKHFRSEPPTNAARRYSPGWVVGGKQAAPGRLSVRRADLNLVRRTSEFECPHGRALLHALTNGFSKKLDNHTAAVALYVAHYNLCRVHETLRITPAKALGVVDHLWPIAELSDAALATQGAGEDQPRPPAPPRFRVIEGGK